MDNSQKTDREDGMTSKHTARSAPVFTTESGEPIVLNLRDYFAAKALPMTVAPTWEMHAKIAYEVADTMLKARQE